MGTGLSSPGHAPLRPYRGEHRLGRVARPRRALRGLRVSGGQFGDTWTFLDGVWTQVPVERFPAPKGVSDPEHVPPDDELVLFSGAGAIGDFDDTSVLYQIAVTVNASTVSGVAPLTVNFTSNVTGAHGAVSGLWDLGDGTTVANLTATEVYAEPGQYFPSFSVTDTNGSIGTVSLHVVVGPALSGSALAAPTSGSAPLTVQCQGLATGGVPPYSFVWTSGSGNQSSGSSPSFTYGAPGRYSLSVSLTDSTGALLSRSFNISVNASPVQPLVVGLSESATSGRRRSPCSSPALSRAARSPIERRGTSATAPHRTWAQPPTPSVRRARSTRSSRSPTPAARHGPRTR